MQNILKLKSKTVDDKRQMLKNCENIKKQSKNVKI